MPQLLTRAPMKRIITSLFDDHPEGVRVLVSPCSLLRMKIDRRGAVVRTMVRIKDPMQLII